MNFIAETATVNGRVRLGEGTSVWFGAVVRGDSSPIEIGSHSNVQDTCVIHGSLGKGVKIGNYVTLGHGAIVHSCDIGDNVLIGINATVLHNARIGDNCIVAAGAVVTPGTEIPSRSMVMGVPAKVVRKITEEERKSVKENALRYEQSASLYAKKPPASFRC
jgi:carbonic anhydrase/acetyltransferase-like protein (isoleucine patch superfamily)